MESPTPDDTRVKLERAREGDKEAVAHLFSRSGPRLLVWSDIHASVAVKRCVDPYDIVQETFARALKRFSSFEYMGKNSFHNWLVRIAHDYILDVAKSLSRGISGKQSLTSFQFDHAYLTSGATGIVEKLHKSDILNHISRAIAEMSEELRLYFSLHFLERLSYTAMAAKLGLPRSTVADRVTAAMEFFRATWKRLFPNDDSGKME